MIKAYGQTEEESSRKGFSRWHIFAAIAGVMLLTVAYISNVISVDNLLKENNKLHKEYNTLLNTNKLLKSELNKLQSAEWINKLAVDTLGMVKSTSLPEVLP